jgi:beta-lactam-binding protein with PASTA domain
MFSSRMRRRLRHRAVAPVAGNFTRMAVLWIVAVASLAVSLGVLGVAAADAHAEELPSLESRSNFAGALEHVKEQISDDGGSIDDLASHLVAYPNTETAIDLDRYLAEMAALDDEYGDDGGVAEVLARLGLSSDSAFAEYGSTVLDGQSETAIIEEMAAHLDSTITDTSVGGSVEAATGGQLIDLATKAGLLDGAVGASLGVVLPTVGALGVLTYLDITNGSNPLSEKLVDIFTSQETAPVEPSRTSASEHLVTATTGVWHYITQCPGKTLNRCWGYQNELEKERFDHGGPLPWPEYYGGKQDEPYGFSPSAAEYDVEKWKGLPGAYVFAWEIGEHYYYGTTYPTSEVHLEPVYNLETECENGNGTIAPMYGWNSISGLPAAIPDSYEYRSKNGETWVCEPYEIVGPPGEEHTIWHTHTGDNEFWYAYRSPSQMQTGFARSGSKTEAEDLGARVVGAVGTPVEGATALERSLEEEIERATSGEDEEAGKIIDYGEKIKVEGTIPRLPGDGEVADCRELTIKECEHALESEGFSKFTVDTLEWRTADLEVAAGHVTGTEPAAGEERETSQRITIIANPESSGMPVEIPAPHSNELFTEYQLELLAAGFIENEDLADVEGDEEPAHDRVVRVSPAPGTRIDPMLVGSTDVVVHTNPQAALVDEIAKALQANNPKVELSEEDAEVVASKCLDEVEAAGIDSSDCEIEPIFVPGSDVPSATEHDIKAIISYPFWVQLNYESRKAKKEKGESREWYVGRGGCSGVAPEGEACDEYPYFASEQGGPGKLEEPSLEYIDGDDNTLEGGFYGGFIRSCKMAERSATDYRFLVVPMRPSLGIPTTSLCNGAP